VKTPLFFIASTAASAAENQHPLFQVKNCEKKNIQIEKKGK